MSAPSMVHRAGDTLVVRSVVSGDALFQDRSGPPPADSDEDPNLPQCKIKRNYTCPHCTYFTQNPRCYLYHLKDSHQEKIRVYECPHCLYASKHSQKLQRHVHMVHVMGQGKVRAKPERRPKPPPSPPPPPPPIEVKAEEQFSCTQCSFSSRSKSLVSRHETLVHLKKKFFRCGKCNYVTHMRARYTKHVKYHSMPMIKCDLCDFRTPYKWNLDRHYKNHTGDGAYKCSQCNFTADIKQSLTVHEMNHHAPPPGAGPPGLGAGGGRRRNKVGASDTTGGQQDGEVDIDKDELELLRLERGDADDEPIPTTVCVTPTVKTRPVARRMPKVKVTLKKTKSLTTQEQNERHNFQTDFIHPDDIIHHKNGNVYIKTLKCRLCNYKAAWEGEMARHENRAHGLARLRVAPPPSSRKPPRPVPNLIPIQNKPAAALPILRIPSVRGRSASLLKPPSTLPPTEPDLSEKDLNEICAKSCPTSALKDFASLIGGEDAFRTDDEPVQSMEEKPEPVEPEPEPEPDPDPELEAEPEPGTATFKRKNASFFDKLKEKLGAAEACNLVCAWCGHESKCLSELGRHQKLHTGGRSSGAGAGGGAPPPSGAELSSTRCQRCRQRCKTSADLVVHLQSCKGANVEPDPEPERSDELIQHPEPENETEPHPMENKVFVWNSLPQPMEAESEEDRVHTQQDEDSRDTAPLSEGSLVGVETAPGYGAVTSKQGVDAPIPTPPPVMRASDSLSVKKVFKCPHCSFWASTASRFHVHIVGHLNKKPFECSLCAYRSNWRWDITKHIRLKAARDVAHERARVLMTDETGRRNYSKYNKFLTLLRVHEPSADSSGSGRRSGSVSQGAASPSAVLQTLPAPPRLTRAPTPVVRPAQPLASGALRPPPPLRAAHQVAFPGPPTLQPQIPQLSDLRPKRAQKRPAKMLFGEEPSTKRASTDSKKTLWKCKKCNYRDSSRELVLAHVKEHYQQRLQLQGDPMERHCRLKHSGDVRVVIGIRNGMPVLSAPPVTPSSLTVLPAAEPTQQAKESSHCDTCPFSCDSEEELEQHLELHLPRPGAVFKCYFCPFYVTTKGDLLQHLRLHGVSEPEDYMPKPMNKVPLKASESDNTGLMHSESSLSKDNSPTKRYKCAGCPYVSNSKSQFLYHKQFHRPRGAPFKCGLCSYNVSRRHLLHQHLRVHGILIPPQKSPSKTGGREDGSDQIEEVSLPPPPALVFTPGPNLDTRRLPDIPLVWVSRGTKFSKMFKCRFCPHVNVRKANIQEHEKMHRVRHKISNTAQEPGKEPGTTLTLTVQQHRCPDCNYICNNAGVLSSHAKVHQGLYGHVHCLVDASRTDEAQLEELNASVVDGNTEVADPLTSQDHEHPSIEEGQEETQDFQLEHSFLNISDTVPLNIGKQRSECDSMEEKMLFFCSHCPARFLYEKELLIHVRFHEIRLAHRCESCTYTSRQRPHLLAHHKVHTDSYQEQTNSMERTYSTCTRHPRPRSAVIVEGPGVEGPVWVVISGGARLSNEPAQQDSKSESTVPAKIIYKQFSCGRCPARFFKSVALQYHVSLHGGTGLYKCRHCDYAVKTYGNLVKHETIHNASITKESKVPTGKIKNKSKNTSGTCMSVRGDLVPLSGTDLFRQKAEAQKQSSAECVGNRTQHEYPPLHVDPQFGILMHGNPDFIYPTYYKNGRLKEKRYKCHKCPSAFEKREQYKVHLSLHGSKQRYKCEKCDYSVKYYANYIQHMRKHQNNEEAQAARKLTKLSLEQSKVGIEEGTDIPDDSTPTEEIAPLAPRSAKKSTGGSNPGRLSLADQQTIMLLQHRRSSSAGTGVPRDTFCCPHCPYSSPRRDGVENHVKRHISVSGVQSNFVCAHCDYTVPQLHFLREHNKVHFGLHKKFVPEAYMKCDRIEIWAQDKGRENPEGIDGMEVTGKRLLFRDSGIGNLTTRYYPPLPSELLKIIDQEIEGVKIHIDLRTGEPVTDKPCSDVDEVEEVVIHEPPDESKNVAAGEEEVVPQLALDENMLKTNVVSGKKDESSEIPCEESCIPDEKENNVTKQDESQSSSASSSDSSSSSSNGSSSSSNNSSSSSSSSDSSNSSSDSDSDDNDNQEVKSSLDNTDSSSSSSDDSKSTM